MNSLYKKWCQKLTKRLLIFLFVIPCFMQAMDPSRKKISLNFFEQATYPYTRNNTFEFEQAKYFLKKNEKDAVGKLKKIAFRKEPDVRAQVFLGLRALKQRECKDANLYLELASRSGHPVAQTELGKSLLKEKPEKAIALLHDAAQPRVLRYYSGCYYHLPAIEFLASLYGNDAKLRYSDNSFYFATLAVQVSDKKKWWEHLGELRLQQAKYFQDLHTQCVKQAAMCFDHAPEQPMQKPKNLMDPSSSSSSGDQSLEQHDREEKTPETLSSDHKVEQQLEQPKPKAKPKEKKEKRKPPKSIDTFSCLMKELSEADTDQLQALLLKIDFTDLDRFRVDNAKKEVLDKVKKSNNATLNFQLGKILAASSTHKIRREGIARLKCVSQKSLHYDDAQLLLLKYYSSDKQLAPKSVEIIKKYLENREYDSKMNPTVKASLASAIESLQDGASDASVMFYLAGLYAKGIANVVDQSEKRAEEALQAAADDNYPPALLECSRRCKGKGKSRKVHNYFERAFKATKLDKEKKEVIESIKSFSDQGDLDASIWMFYHYIEKERGKEVALQMLFKLIEPRGKGINSKAILKFGGNDVFKTIEKWKAKNSLANYLLGRYYAFKADQPKQNRKKYLSLAESRLAAALEADSDEIYRKDTSQFLGSIQYNLGDCFVQVNDLINAEKYLRKALQNGVPNAGYLLSKILLVLEIDSKSKDRQKEGLALLKKAAATNGDAAYYWGFLAKFFAGKIEGLPEQDREEFIGFLRREAESNDPCYAIELLEGLGEKVKKPSIEDFKKRLKGLLSKNNASAHYTMARVYGLQEGESEEYLSAQEFHLKQAEQFGCNLATARLGLLFFKKGEKERAFNSLSKFFSTENIADSCEFEDLKHNTLEALTKLDFFENDHFLFDYWVNIAEKNRQACILDNSAICLEHMMCSLKENPGSLSKEKLQERRKVLKNSFDRIKGKQLSFIARFNIAMALLEAYKAGCSFFAENGDFLSNLLRAKELLKEAPVKDLSDLYGKARKEALSSVYEGLGLEYEKKQNKRMALKNYLELLTLNPTHNLALAKVLSLEKDPIKKFSVTEKAARNGSRIQQLILFVLYNRGGTFHDKSIEKDPKEAQCYYDLFNPEKNTTNPDEQFLNSCERVVRDMVITPWTANKAFVFFTESFLKELESEPQGLLRDLILAQVYFLMGGEDNLNKMEKRLDELLKFSYQNKDEKKIEVAAKIQKSLLLLEQASKEKGTEKKLEKIKEAIEFVKDVRGLCKRLEFNESKDFPFLPTAIKSLGDEVDKLVIPPENNDKKERLDSLLNDLFKS